MKAKPQYFICKHCGNVVEKLHDSGVPVVCCGENMAQLVPNTQEAAQEKHIPAVTVEGGNIHVQVGSVIHPMLEEHYIGWIWLETEQGGQRRSLSAGQEPKAVFTLAPGDKALAVYAWCNLHGVWMAEM